MHDRPQIRCQLAQCRRLAADGDSAKGIADYQYFKTKWAMMNTIANPSPTVMK
jgi:hypothetical protein